tara:strand:+ start:522 stop:1196 length:675 start_codon:yes stop_codon:yes gene_type:complete
MRGPIVDFTPVDFPGGVKHNGAIAFLDRDGVLNLGKSTYVNSPEELEILSGAPQAVGDLRRLGFRTCIVTNQSPIMRGLWDENQLFLIHEKLRQLFLESDADAHFDMIITCPHRNRDNCSCRKPKPGMLQLGSKLLRSKTLQDFDTKQKIMNLDPTFEAVNWWKEKISPENELDLMIGDRNSDMGAGWAIGARLFRVPQFIGIKHVNNRIIDNNDKGDFFNPIR